MSRALVEVTPADRAAASRRGNPGVPFLTPMRPGERAIPALGTAVSSKLKRQRTVLLRRLARRQVTVRQIISMAEGERAVHSMRVISVIAWSKGKTIMRSKEVGEKRNSTKKEYRIVGYAAARKIMRELDIHERLTVGRLGPLQTRRLLDWAKEW